MPINDPYSNFNTGINSVINEINDINEIVNYKILKFNDTINIKTCPISLENFNENDVIIKLECNHIFAKDNISKWIHNGNKTCPVCRHVLVSEDNQKIYDEAIRQWHVSHSIETMISFLSDRLINRDSQDTDDLEGIFEIY